MRKIINRLVVLSGIAFLTPGLSYATWYVGVGAGQTNIETEALDFADTVGPVSLAIDDSDSSYKVFGGWRATPSFALEFGYADLGKYTGTLSSPSINVNQSMEATAIFVEGVGTINLGGGWRFLGKLGVAVWDGEVNYSDNTPFSSSGSGDGPDPVLGLGFEYVFKLARTQLGLRLEWEQYQNVWEDVSYSIDSTQTEVLNGLDINTFGLAITYDF